MAAIILFLQAAGASAVIAETRLAILAEEPSASVEALLVSRLSGEAQIALLERQDLDLIRREKSLGEAGEQARLAGADFLVVVDRHTVSDPPLFGIRMVETSTGTLSLYRFFPSDETLRDSIAACATEIAAIAAAPPSAANRIPVVLLGLRFELPQREHPAREYALNQALASALHHEPDLRILERWQSEALLFERIAKTDLRSPLESGALLIDGTLSETPDALRLALRLRTSEDQAGRIVRIESPNGEAADLVEDVLTFVREFTKARAPRERDADQEADLFGKLALWALTNGMAEEAVAAAETAVALAPDEPDLLLQRIQVHAFRAWPRPLAVRYLEYKDLVPESFEPVPRLRAASHALRLLEDLERLPASAPPAAPGENGTTPTTERENAALRLAFDAACLIRRIQDAALENDAATELAELRLLLQSRIAKLASSPSLETRTSLVFQFVNWTSALAVDAQESGKAFDFLMKINLGPNNYRRDPARYIFAQGLLLEFGDHGDRDYHLNTGKLLPSPTKRMEQKEVWLEKAREMVGRQPIRDRITGFTLQTALLRENEEKLRPVLEEFASLLWENRQTLVETAPHVLQSSKILFIELSEENAPAPLADYRRRYLNYLLKDVESLDPSLLSLFSGHHIRWSSEDVVELLPALEDYQKRRRPSEEGTSRFDHYVGELRSTLEEGLRSPTERKRTLFSRPTQRPAPAPRPEAEPEKIPGTLYARQWMNPEWLLRGGRLAGRTLSHVVQDESGEIWAIHPRGILRFMPDAPESAQYLFLPRPHKTGLLSITTLPKHVIITSGSEIWVTDKDAGNWWERIPAPPGDYTVVASGEKAFLVYRPPYNSLDFESGILSYHPDTRRIEVIASSRKESAADGPDGRADWTPRFAFATRGGIVVSGKVTGTSDTRHQLYFRSASGEAWTRPFQHESVISRRFSCPDGGTVLTLGSGTYLGHSDTEQVVYFPPDGAPPKLLASLKKPPSGRPYVNLPVLPQKPQWILPDRFVEVEHDRNRVHAALYHEGRLYLASADFDAHFKKLPTSRFLHVCDQDGTVRSLPLAFEVPADLMDGTNVTADDVAKLKSSGPAPDAMFLLPDGLLLGAAYRSPHSIIGFWKISFSDIDTLLAAAPTSPPPLAKPALP